MDHSETRRLHNTIEKSALYCYCGSINLGCSCFYWFYCNWGISPFSSRSVPSLIFRPTLLQAIYYQGLKWMPRDEKDRRPKGCLFLLHGGQNFIWIMLTSPLPIITTILFELATYTFVTLIMPDVKRYFPSCYSKSTAFAKIASSIPCSFLFR